MDSSLLFPLIAAAVVGLVMVYLFMASQRKEYSKHVKQLQPKAKKPKEFKEYTREEVAKHCTRNDAWTIIQHKDTKEWRVYDMTDYIDEHPGGDSILNNMGGDSTEGFHGPQHPATVFVMVEEFCIGKLAAGQ